MDYEASWEEYQSLKRKRANLIKNAQKTLKNME